MRPRALLSLALAALLAPAAASGAAPRTAIFYYPWYGTPRHDGAFEHWHASSALSPLELASEYYPARGPYSSSDPAVLAAQMDDVAQAGIDEVVSSWWGWGSPEDRRLPAVLAAARAVGVEVAVHLEPYPGRSIESTAADIAHLRTLGITDFYAYRPLDFPAAAWAELNSSLEGVRVFAQTALPGFAAAGGFDGIYTYDILVYGGASFGRICGSARRLGLLCAPSVGPGYEAVRATGDPRVKPRRGGLTYDAMWTAALRTGADLVTITSYNEWGEGTQIEPARSASGYRSYAGAWGARGHGARTAYLAHTASWTEKLRRSALRR